MSRFFCEAQSHKFNKIKRQIIQARQLFALEKDGGALPSEWGTASS